jgi:hypothetical protein
LKLPGDAAERRGESVDPIELVGADALKGRWLPFAPTPRFLSVEKTATMADHLSGRVAKADTP